MSLIYCYGIIESNQDFDIRGFDSEKINLIPFKDAYAVVSSVSEKRFSQEVIDKNIKDMIWLEKNGQIHEQVIGSIMQKTTIIPMKFCTIFRTKKNVEEMLKERYADFKFNLNNLKNKVEIGVKVYFDTEPLKQQVLEKDNEFKQKSIQADEKSKISPGIAYFDKQKIDILLKERISQILADDKKKIIGKLKMPAEESRENGLLNKKLTGKDMLLNVVFLVKEQDLDQFKSNFERIRWDYNHLDFKLWGPFPPYNFVK